MVLTSLVVIVSVLAVWRGLRLVDRIFTGQIGAIPHGGPLAWLAVAGFVLGFVGFMGLITWSFWRYPQRRGPGYGNEEVVPTWIPWTFTTCLIAGFAAWTAAHVLTQRRLDSSAAESAPSDTT